MTERLREDASPYAEARCGLPGCGEALSITWSYARGIDLRDTREVLCGPGTGNTLTATWEVRCAAGHVVLLPADTADDWYEFGGRCTCNPDYDDAEAGKRCAHNDMARLRAVLAPEQEG